MKVSGYDHRRPLRLLMKPNITWSNQPHLVRTYHDYGHPIIVDPYNSAKNNQIDMNVSGYDHGGPLRLFMKSNLTRSNINLPSQDLS